MQRIKEKEILKRDIEKLKLLRSGLEKGLEFYENSRRLNDDSEIVNEIHTENFSDTCDDWKYDLYKYSGFVCSKNIPGKECVFEFNSFKKDSNNETYFVQILFEKEEIKLGGWKMPILLDVRDIFSKYLVNDLNQLRSFLLSCKHYLNCRENRQSQFNDLKVYVDSLNNCDVQSNKEIFTYIELQMFHLKDLESDSIINVSLYINYELDEVKPSKLIIHPVYEECFHVDMKRKLIKFLKDFKHLELKSALEKIVNEKIGDYFQWDVDIKNLEEDVQNEETVENEDDEREENSQNEKTQDEEYKLNNNDNREKLEKAKSSKKQINVTKVRPSQQTEKSKLKKNTVQKNVEKGKKNKKLIEDETEKENMDRKKRKAEEKEKKSEVVSDTSGLRIETSKKRNTVNSKQISEKTGKQTNLTKTLDLQTENPKKKSADKTKKIKNSQSKIQPEKTEKQTTLTEIFSLQIAKPNKQKPDKTKPKIKETETINQPVKSPGKKRKPEMKEKKIKNTAKKFKNKGKRQKKFTVANFALNQEPQKSPTIESTAGNLLTADSQVSITSTPIPGPSQIHLEIDSSEISEIVPDNKPVMKTSTKQTRISYSTDSDSELDQVLEEPDENLLHELEQIEDNSSNVPRKKKSNRKRTQKK